MENNPQAIEAMTAAEFHKFADDILMAPDLPPEAFFTALSALHEEDVTEAAQASPQEISATIKNGKLAFLEPAPLFVRENEFWVGSHHYIIKLVTEPAASV